MKRNNDFVLFTLFTLAPLRRFLAPSLLKRFVEKIGAVSSIQNLQLTCIVSSPPTRYLLLATCYLLLATCYSPLPIPSNLRGREQNLIRLGIITYTYMNNLSRCSQFILIIPKAFAQC